MGYMNHFHVTEWLGYSERFGPSSLNAALIVNSRPREPLHRQREGHQGGWLSDRHGGCGGTLYFQDSGLVTGTTPRPAMIWLMHYLGRPSPLARLEIAMRNSSSPVLL